MLSSGSLFFRMVVLWLPFDFPYAIFDFFFIWNLILLSFLSHLGVMLGRFGGHVGVILVYFGGF